MELILMQIGSSGSWGKGMKRSTLGSRGQSSRSHEAADSWGLAEASFSIPWGHIAFLVVFAADDIIAFYCCSCCTL